MAITRGLTTVANVKLSLNIASGISTWDTDFENYISAATPVIEFYTGPMYGESRTVVVDGDGTHAIRLPFKFATVTTVTVDGTLTTSFVANAAAGIIYAGTSASPGLWSVGTQNISVVVTVGYATIPPNVALAARELVRHWWQNGRQSTNPAGGPTITGDSPPPISGVMTRRLGELLQANPPLAGFA